MRHTRHLIIPQNTICHTFQQWNDATEIEHRSPHIHSHRRKSVSSVHTQTVFSCAFFRPHHSLIFSVVGTQNPSWKIHIPIDGGAKEKGHVQIETYTQFFVCNHRVRTYKNRAGISWKSSHISLLCFAVMKLKLMLRRAHSATANHTELYSQ